MSRGLRSAATSWVGLVALIASTACTHGSSTGPSEIDAPPAATCPAAVAAQSGNGQAVRVTFDDPRATGAIAPLTITCTPPSGESFPVGTTMVACTITDARQRTFSCSFSVKVVGPPRLSTSTILAFGDSLTFGSSPPDVVDSYPSHLRPKLTARYVGQSINLINDGRAGENAQATGRTRLPTALDIYRPGALLLMEGSNDLLGGTAGANAGLAALTEMVRAAKSRNVTVLLATLPPQRMGGVRDGVAKMIPGFNEQIKTLAQNEGVTLVDIFAAMGGDGRYIGRDDEHPTQEGFEVMAQAFFDTMRQKLEVAQ